MPQIKIISSLNEIPLSSEWREASKFNCKERIVDEKGRYSSTFEGRRYQIVAKMERSLTGSEKFFKRFLGTIAVICSLGLALIFKPVYRLFNSKTSMRYATFYVPKPLNLVKPSLPINVSSYEDLKEKIDKKDSTVLLTDESGKHPEKLLEILGQGGSKKAIKLSNNRALILPNMDVDSVSDVSKRWERVVLEEVAMSKALNSIGLLSPSLKQVNISLNETSEDVIPAYISDTFENLAKTKGWYIIDQKNTKSSSWKKHENHLFNSEQDCLNINNWKSVIDPMLTDIAKICMYDIPVATDSLNVAVTKKTGDSLKGASEYEIRYFGFDFSNKNQPLSIPTLEQKNLSTNHRKKVEFLLFSLLENVFFHEFDEEFALKKHVVEFIDKLVSKYTDEVLSRIHG